VLRVGDVRTQGKATRVLSLEESTTEEKLGDKKVERGPIMSKETSKREHTLLGGGKHAGHAARAGARKKLEQK